MTDEQRLKNQIAEQQKKWDLLSKKLSKLEQEKILATDTEEIFRLENKIAELTTERQQIEQQLQELESKISLESSVSSSPILEDKESKLDEKTHKDDQSGQLQSIEFVNRATEIEYITNYCPPYLLISAPMEYGKTRLLEAVRIQLQKQNWFCIHIELSREKLSSYSINDLTCEILQQLDEKQDKNLKLTTPEKAGTEVGTCILKKLDETQKNVLLMVDEVEAIDEDVAKVFLNQFILSLHEKLSYHFIQLTSIFAGRYILDWKELGNKIPLQPNPLTPFDFSAVFQTVEKFASKKLLRLPLNYKPELASHLMYFTGGHPGCMAKILIKDFGNPIQVIMSNKDEYYKKIVKPVIDEIIENMPPDLEEVFDTLCVARYFNARLLQRFIDKALLKWSKTGENLGKFLLKIYLVNRKSGFLKDEITQRLLAIRLRREKFDHFVTVCKESIAFYESQLEIPTLSGREILAVELLFQKMHYLFYKKQSNKEQFLEIVPDILDKLVINRDDPEGDIDRFIETLGNDWEFRFTFNYLFRERPDEYPFNEFMEQIKDFRENL